MTTLKCFVVFDTTTGERLATLPLTVPIGATVEAYINEGLQVRWTWAEMEIQ